MTSHKDTRIYAVYGKNSGLPWTLAICKKLGLVEILKIRPSIWWSRWLEALRLLFWSRWTDISRRRIKVQTQLLSCSSYTINFFLTQRWERLLACPGGVRHTVTGGRLKTNTRDRSTQFFSAPSTHSKRRKASEGSLSARYSQKRQICLLPGSRKQHSPVHVSASTGNGFICMAGDKPICCSPTIGLDIVSCLPAKGVSLQYLIPWPKPTLNFTRELLRGAGGTSFAVKKGKLNKQGYDILRIAPAKQLSSFNSNFSPLHLGKQAPFHRYRVAEHLRTSPSHAARNNSTANFTVVGSVSLLTSQTEILCCE